MINVQDNYRNTYGDTFKEQGQLRNEARGEIIQVQ